MNIIFDNGQLEWDAISTISNSFLVLALVLITYYYAGQVAMQTKFMKSDRLYEEMDKLVAPLNSKIGDKIIFQKKVPGNIDSSRHRDRDYYIFWNAIKQNKYLAPQHLHSAIDKYLKNKFPKIDDEMQVIAYENAEAELFAAIKKRYSELYAKLLKIRGEKHST